MRSAPADPIDELARHRAKKEPPWRDQLIRNNQGAPRAQLANAITALREAPEWHGHLYFDEFAIRTVLVAPPPWEAGGNQPWVSRPWTDHDDILAANWLQHESIGVGADTAAAAVEAVAHDQAFHPVRDYLDGLSWDGVRRTGTWLTAYLGADPSRYTEAVGERFLISAVARVFQPGAKADHAVVLEGPQGIGKSTACRVLAGDWFTDEISDLGSKDASLQVQGVWVVELGELGAMARPEVERVKAFLSRSTDRFRPAYGRRVVEVPRQCIFIGTTNAEGYLRDETGARRFWPVRVRSLDLDALRRDRDQLWAEAFYLYRKGAPWWLDTDGLISDATEEQAARYAGDPWHDTIAAFVKDRDSVTVADIMGEALGLEISRRGQAEQNRVARILRTLGFERKQVRLRGSNDRVWHYLRMGT
jgi:predicted P-loop ATPase